MNWILRTSQDNIMRFKSLIDAIHYAESNKIHDCTIEGPALEQIEIMRSISEVELAGFKIESECFLANFDGKVN